MKKMITALTLGMAVTVGAATVAPTMAEAKTCRTHRQNTANRGTLYGAVGGALLGSAVAGHGAKTEGAVLGGTVGALAGHHIAKKRVKCGTSRHYVRRYYVRNGVRHYYYVRR